MLNDSANHPTGYNSIGLHAKNQKWNKNDQILFCKCLCKNLHKSPNSAITDCLCKPLHKQKSNFGYTFTFLAPHFSATYKTTFPKRHLWIQPTEKIVVHICELTWSQAYFGTVPFAIIWEHNSEFWRVILGRHYPLSTICTILNIKIAGHFSIHAFETIPQHLWNYWLNKCYSQVCHRWFPFAYHSLETFLGHQHSCNVASVYPSSCPAVSVTLFRKLCIVFSIVLVLAAEKESCWRISFCLWLMVLSILRQNWRSKQANVNAWELSAL